MPPNAQAPVQVRKPVAVTDSVNGQGLGRNGFHKNACRQTGGRRIFVQTYAGEKGYYEFILISLSLNMFIAFLLHHSVCFLSAFLVFFLGYFLNGSVLLHDNGLHFIVDCWGPPARPVQADGNYQNVI